MARYAATGQLGPAVAAAVRVQQDSEAAVAAALALAAVLERVIVAGDSVQVHTLSPSECLGICECLGIWTFALTGVAAGAGVMLIN